MIVEVGMAAGSGSGRRPQRRCVVCRRSTDKAALARLAAGVDGRLTWDRQYRLPGRGAYVHRDPNCIAQMCSPKLWLRALRVKSEGGQGVVSRVAEDLRKVYAELMAAAVE